MVTRRVGATGRTGTARGAVLGALVAVSVVVAGCGSGSGSGAADRSGSSGSSQSADASVETSGQSAPATPTPVLDPANPPPYIDRTEWVQTAVGPSLQIYPTPAGRRTIATAARADSWAEVVRQAPDADTPGMREQYFCHWDFARLVEPDKPTWNIEPERPVVTDQQMIGAQCNPGAPEE